MQPRARHYFVSGTRRETPEQPAANTADRETKEGYRGEKKDLVNNAET